MNIALILAGGVGSRVGADRPKQFIEIYGKPVLAYTVEVFQNHNEIDLIEIVCVESYIDYFKKIISQYRFTKVRWVVQGGETFQESVIKGIRNIERDVDADDIVLIHYGAAPFVSEDIISDGIKVCCEKGNSVSAVPCFSLIGSNDDGKISTKWLDRDEIMILNSPQSFRFGYLLKLYQEAEEKGILDKVDPHTTSLMYALGHTIFFSKGNQTNIKITTQEDLELFKAYALLKNSK